MSRFLKPCLIVLFVFATMAALPSPSQAQVAVGLSIRIGPPALPVYAQPICPGPGYLWTPGYWAYGPDGYYWVPGTWVVAPAVGLLWTPGYWGWSGGFYAWHAGYWGPHVGFYGGINYGFGYGGVGFVGGEWRGGVFAYNRAVMNVNTTVIHNTYINNTVVNKTVVNNTSFNGGPGGINARPNAAEQMASREHHVSPVAAQTQHEHAASQNRAFLASENHGRPAIAATSRAGEFSGRGVTATRAAGTNNNRPANTNAVRGDRPPNSGQANRGPQGENRPNTSNTSRPNNNTNNNSRPNYNERPNNNNNNSHSNNERPSNNNSHPSGGHGNERPEHPGH